MPLCPIEPFRPAVAETDETSFDTFFCDLLAGEASHVAFRTREMVEDIVHPRREVPEASKAPAQIFRPVVIGVDRKIRHDSHPCIESSGINLSGRMDKELGITGKLSKLLESKTGRLGK